MTEALANLYHTYSDNPTDKQKIAILERELGGTHNVSYMGMWKDTEADHDRVKVSVLEMSWLEAVGLYEPDFH